ncbi:MAG: glycosyl transferase [Bryobacterales bacterium]|nr:glycosyl transferase [Acidobacteriota bacterium]MCB9383239.1 glycosyl transferase [Bryobacterales bacterium]
MDFHQNGAVATLHNLTRRSVEELEADLQVFAKQRPMALVLPSLYSELEGPALGHIVDELSKTTYLSQIVIGLDRADERQYRHALEYFSRLPQRHRVLWNDGPRLRAVDATLADAGLAPAEPGKGRNVWYCFGYVLATREAGAVALHDCDIVTYSRDLPARLIYPVANPAFSYYFCKGYYARVSNERMHGRVTRLLVTPLLRALRRVCGPSAYLDYMESFRYPLAGEFSLRSDVIGHIRIPSDWGLEIGVLSEMQRDYSTNRICQVDIADSYDHKHQALSPDDAARGLSKMSTDIAKTLFRKLATLGEVFSSERIRTIKATYYRTALDMIEAYANDAALNGLHYDRHAEEQAVELFTRNVVSAGSYFLENPSDTPFMPSWNRVISAVPEVLDQMVEAVEADTAEFSPK